MDNPFVYYGLFLAATFCAAVVAGVSGFAFALIAAGVWLHVLTPWQTATLLIGFGLMVQGLAVWKLRHAIEWAKLWPFLLGAAVGVPIGVAMLGRADPHTLQIAVGA